MSRLIPTYIISLFLRVIIKIITITSKIKIVGEQNIEKIIKNNQPMLMCVWHGRLLFPCLWAKTLDKKPWIIASNHRDAQIIVNIFRNWRFNIIRGSSGKGGDTVIEKMEGIFSSKSNNWIGVTNDGPKGPAKIAKSGSIKAAINNNAYIVSITGSSNKNWILKTWDSFMLPKPFSKIIINISKPLEINENYDINYVNSYITEKQIEADQIVNKCD